MLNQRFKYILRLCIVYIALFVVILIRGLSEYEKSEMIPVEDVSIHMTLMSNGDALMEETWDITPNRGKEIFLKRSDLGITEITDFHVTDNGTAMKEVPDWMEKSREDVPCCGLYILGKENHKYELCWNIDGYRRHVYEIRYTLKNFISKYTDGSGFYHTFFLAESFIPSHISLTISSEEIDLDGVKVESYGFAGSAGFQDGVYTAKSFGKLRKEDYIRTVMIFPEDTFHDLVKDTRGEYPWISTRSDCMEYAKDNSENRAYGKVLTILTYVGFPLAAIILVLLIAAALRRQKRIAARNLSEIRLEDSLKCYNVHKGIRGWITPFYLSVYGIFACTMLGIGRYAPSYRILGYAWFGSLCALFLLFSGLMHGTGILGKPVNTGRLVRVSDKASEDGIFIPLQKSSTGRTADFLKDLTLEEAWFLFMMLGEKKVTSTSIFGAYFAKWSAENLVDKGETVSGYEDRISFTPDFSQMAVMTKPEREMYDFLRSEGNIIGFSEIEKLCRKEYEQYFNWMDSTRKDAFASLKEKGLTDAFYSEDCWWFVSCEPVFTEEGAKLAGKIRGFLKVCSDAEELSKLLSEYDGHEADHILACVGFTENPRSLAEQMEKLPGEISEQQRRIWAAAFVGSMFGQRAASRGMTAAQSARSTAHGGGLSGGGFSGGGSSGGGGGGIR